MAGESKSQRIIAHENESVTGLECSQEMDALEGNCCCECLPVPRAGPPVRRVVRADPGDAYEAAHVRRGRGRRGRRRGRRRGSRRHARGVGGWRREAHAACLLKWKLQLKLTLVGRGGAAGEAGGSQVGR